MAEGFEGAGAGAAGFDDSGFLDQGDGFEVFAEALLNSGPDGVGGGLVGGELMVENEWQDGGDGFFTQAFELGGSLEGERGDALAAAASYGSFLVSPGPVEVLSDEEEVLLAGSLDDAAAILLNNKLRGSATPLPTAGYTPLASVLEAEPEATLDLTAIYKPLTTLHFRTSADAKAHRRRARLPPKAQALDTARVKHHGRDYWVRRIYNAMIDIRYITDGDSSIHRTRFTQMRAFHALDLEATAHHIFDEAVAVHERGWNRPTVYHKKVVRGKLVDLSETSVEMRLSRICRCLQQKKSSVDDAVRGGVTLALLCDNPEARSFTKASNDVGNRKRGERLRVTSAREKAKEAQAQQQEVEVEVEGG